jgi:hypothetical protein
MIFDFHAHPTSKPYNSRSIYHTGNALPDTHLWKERFRPRKLFSKIPKKIESEVNYTSQIHLNALAEGKVRGMCVSIYPLERVFTIGFEKIEHSVFYKFIISIDIINFILRAFQRRGKRFFFRLVGTLIGYDPEVIKRLNEGVFNYYEQTLGEIDYLAGKQDETGNGKLISYRIARNYTEYKTIIQEGKLAFLLSLEGSNCILGNSVDFDELVQKDQANERTNVITLLKQNLLSIKQHNYPPFVITVAHHQYNFLCGHAPSFVGFAKAALNQEGYTTNPDNSDHKLHYFLLGLHDEGKEFIRMLLDKSFGGRRILIDTKHMSVRARYEYHQLLKNEYSDEDIPIIQTHTAVSGRPISPVTLTQPKDLELSKSKRKNIPFNSGSINLFDDEIVDIVDSNGLIGIMIDEKRLVGDKLPEDTEWFAQKIPAAKELTAMDDPNYRHVNRINKLPINRFKNQKKALTKARNAWVENSCNLEVLILEGRGDSGKANRIRRRITKLEKKVATLKATLVPVFLSILMNQYLHIVKVYERAKTRGLATEDYDPWKHLCIGTDYEGVINPLDTYFYASELSDLESQLVSFINHCLANSNVAFNVYRQFIPSEQVQEIVKDILWNNSEQFLANYFTEDYLKP